MASVNNTQKKYEAAKRFLAIANSSYGKKIRQEKPHLVALAKKIVDKNQTEYIDFLSQNNTEVEAFLKEIKEAEGALKLISEDSQVAVRELNELISENSKKLSNIALFDPNEFYDQYFFSIVSPMTENLNEDILNDERFTLWFANSKCVDDSKKPLLLYHGTGGLKINEFDEFSFSLFPGAYFAENKSYADWFANYRKGKALLYRVYLRVTNPIDLTSFKLDKVTYSDFVNFIKFTYGYSLPENKMLKAISAQQNGLWAWQYLRSGVDWLKHIKAHREFDGFVYYENNPNDISSVTGEENYTKAWLVLSANQIKSADTRNQTFSLESNSMKMKQGGVIC